MPGVQTWEPGHVPLQVGAESTQGVPATAGQLLPPGGFQLTVGSLAQRMSMSNVTWTRTAPGKPLATLIAGLVVRPMHASPPTSSPYTPGVPLTGIGAG